MIDDTISTNHGNNHCITAVAEKKNGVDMKNVDTKARIDIRIPKQSRIYDYLYVDKSCRDNEKPKWQRLDELLEIATQMKYDWAEKIFDEFVGRLALFYPDKRDALRKLRSLVLWQILEGEELSEEYYSSTIPHLGRGEGKK